MLRVQWADYEKCDKATPAKVFLSFASIGETYIFPFSSF